MEITKTAAEARAIGCICWDVEDEWAAEACPVHGKEIQRENSESIRFEIEAENAWLREAERGTPEDYAFEKWESDNGLIG